MKKAGPFSSVIFNTLPDDGIFEETGQEGFDLRTFYRRLFLNAVKGFRYDQTRIRWASLHKWLSDSTLTFPALIMRELTGEREKDFSIASHPAALEVLAELSRTYPTKIAC